VPPAEAESKLLRTRLNTGKEENGGETPRGPDVQRPLNSAELLQVLKKKPARLPAHKMKGDAALF
jgi:hypothetical protein